jgi:acyl-homoserine lactone acylase PvdQ
VTSRRRGRAGIVGATIALLVTASLVVTGLILVYRPLPTIDGEFRLLGLDQRAEILRDSYGVPHVYAQTAHDLFYLQGYATAQDRLFQMDLYRRAAAGRLAEVLGEAALDSDKQFRTFGLERVAGRELRLLRPETIQNLAAYAEGVNKFLEQHGDSLPIEFVILGYRPGQWSVVDSVIVAKLQAYDAAGNLAQELLRAGLASRFGPGVLATLMPDPSGRAASIDEHAWAAVAPYLSGRGLSPSRQSCRAPVRARARTAGLWPDRAPSAASLSSQEIHTSPSATRRSGTRSGSRAPATSSSVFHSPAFRGS